jgi:two-component system sensor histidine kinase/response regulator
MMGGELTASSEVGKGSKFGFDIQVKIVDVSEVLTARSIRRAVRLEPGQRAQDGNPYRLLIVEDVEANRKLLTKLLRSLGFRVREAENGQEAVKVWKEWQPHLIWMDIRMPIMDGYKATRHIKALPQGKETIIVALTAGAFEGERAAALSAGCDDFLRKPASESDILDTLTRHLDLRFVYEETDEQIPGEFVLVEEETSTTLADMSPKWLTDMYQATLEGDLDWMQSLIEQIRPQYPVVADTLANLADNYAHEEILNLIPTSSEELMKGTA